MPYRLLTTYQQGCTFKYHKIGRVTQTPNDPGWHTNLTSHRLQQHQAIVDIDAFGPPKKLGIGATKGIDFTKNMDGIPTQTCWDTQNERKIFGRNDFNSNWVPEKIHQCIVGPGNRSFLFFYQETLAEFPIEQSIFMIEWSDSNFYLLNPGVLRRIKDVSW